MALGFGQILIVLVLVLVIFGAGKLPKVMGDLGKGMRNFKDGVKGVEEPEAKETVVAELVKNTAELDKEEDNQKAA